MKSTKATFTFLALLLAALGMGCDAYHPTAPPPEEPERQRGAFDDSEPPSSSLEGVELD